MRFNPTPEVKTEITRLFNKQKAGQSFTTDEILFLKEAHIVAYGQHEHKLVDLLNLMLGRKNPISRQAARKISKVAREHERDSREHLSKDLRMFDRGTAAGLREGAAIARRNPKRATRVIFRVFPEGDVIAFLPDLTWDFKGNITSYQHIGQHSGADPALIKELRPATLKEYGPLWKELEQRGYKLTLSRENPWRKGEYLHGTTSSGGRPIQYRQRYLGKRKWGRKEIVDLSSSRKNPHYGRRHTFASKKFPGGRTEGQWKRRLSRARRFKTGPYKEWSAREIAMGHDNPVRKNSLDPRDEKLVGKKLVGNPPSLRPQYMTRQQAIEELTWHTGHEHYSEWSNRELEDEWLYIFERPLKIILTRKNPSSGGVVVGKKLLAVEYVDAEKARAEGLDNPSTPWRHEYKNGKVIGLPNGDVLLTDKKKLWGYR